VVLVVLPISDTRTSELMADLRTQDPRVCVVMTGRDAEIHGAPEAFEHGAQDYVSHPVGRSDEVLFVLGLILGSRAGDAQLRYLRKKDATGTELHLIVGRSPAMRKVATAVRNICHRTSSGITPTILIQGETGTGKGLLAKSIHYHGNRRSRAFVDVNCAAIPGSLIEAELFGYERGAFTDARTGRPGLFETADGGTIFLDEIGAMALNLQAKLLTAVEEKKLRRLGGRKPVKVDVQVIVATNRDLASMVDRGEFRVDLYHRLNVLAVALPPLRERGDDKLLLAETFVRSLCEEYGLPRKRLAEEARRAIDSYPWPGNVRELKNQLERVILLEDDDVIRAHQFAFSYDDVDVDVADTGNELRIRLPDDGVSLEALERATLNEALQRCDNNVSRAARFLRISRHTMMYRLKKYNLTDHVDDRRNTSDDDK
jgi:DNA-binding NtrC family response regulator